MKKSHGFSAIEVMFVIVIISVVIFLVAPILYNKYIESRHAVDQSNAMTLVNVTKIIMNENENLSITGMKINVNQKIADKEVVDSNVKLFLEKFSEMMKDKIPKIQSYKHRDFVINIGLDGVIRITDDLEREIYPNSTTEFSK